MCEFVVVVVVVVVERYTVFCSFYKMNHPFLSNKDTKVKNSRIISVAIPSLTMLTQR